MQIRQEENNLNFIFSTIDSKPTSLMKERDFEKTVDSTMLSGQLKHVNTLITAKKPIEK